MGSSPVIKPLFGEIQDNHGEMDQTRYDSVIRYSSFIHTDQVLSDGMSKTENAIDAAQNAGIDTVAQGPPGGLPDVVPGFVSDLLATIREGASGLGESISELASGANPAEVAAVAADVAAVIPL